MHPFGRRTESQISPTVITTLKGGEVNREITPRSEQQYKLRFKNGAGLDEHIDKYTLKLTLENTSTSESSTRNSECTLLTYYQSFFVYTNDVVARTADHVNDTSSHSKSPRTNRSYSHFDPIRPFHSCLLYPAIMVLLSVARYYMRKVQKQTMETWERGCFALC
jgi:hypothetical protein